MKYYILTYIASDPRDCWEDTEYYVKSRFFINSATSVDGIVETVFKYVKACTYEKQLHIVIDKLEHLNQYTDREISEDWFTHPEDLYDPLSLDPYQLYPDDATKFIVDFPGEYAGHETGEMPLTIEVRKKLQERYWKYCNEENEKAKKKLEAEKAKAQEEYRKEFAEYERLKRKFQTVEDHPF